MQSTASFFSVSPALIRENLRRFWAVPAFGFVVYFFSGIFPLLMNGGSSWYYTLRNMLNFANPGFVFSYCLFPILAAVLLQRYLYAPGAVAVMHSLPFTRQRLFNSNFISGLLLVWLPIIAVGLICLLLKRPDFKGFMLSYSDLGTPFRQEQELLWEQITSAPHILSRFALMLLLTLFVYAVCVLAGMVTGNTPLHLITCGVLNGIAPAVVLLGYAYCTRFLFGFAESDGFTTFIASLSPAIYFPVSGGAPGGAVIALYIVVAVLIWAFAGALYARRPLEKAGDSIVFPFMELVFCCFTALAGMTAAGYYFEAVYKDNHNYPYRDSDLYFCLGMVVGAAVAFALARIIVKKTPRIWNRATAFQFGTFALVALLLFIGLRFDLYGYERRVPAAAGVESAELFIPSARYNAIVRLNRDRSNTDAYTFRDAQNKEAVAAFHSRVAENRNALRDAARLRAPGGRSVNASLRYALSSGVSMSRSWSLPIDFCAEDASLRALAESEEFRAQNSLANPAIGRILNIRINNEISNGFDIDFSLSSDEFEGFVSAFNADLRLLTYDKLFDLTVPLAAVQVDFDQDAPSEDPQISNSVYLDLPADFAHTVAWLSAEGYYDRLTAWYASVRSIRLTHVKSAPAPGAPQTVSAPQLASGEEFVAEFRDPALIRAALERMESGVRDASEYWILRFEPAQAGADASGGGGPAYGEAPYPEARGELVFYLNPGNPMLDTLLAAAGKN